MVLFSILSLYIITHVHSISLETFSIFLANFEFCRLSQLLARFLCKEYTATTLPQYISPAKPYFLSSDIAIIPYAAFVIYCIYRDTLLCLAYSLLLQYKNHRYTKRMDFSTLFFAYYFSAIFYNHSQQAFMLHCSDSAISIANSILILELS